MTPINPSTQKSYQGNNAEKLVQVANDHGYSSCQFATFNQWRKLGRSVLKGQKSKVRIIALSEKDGDRKCRAVPVFALEQTVE